jgi:hypothetical protein
VPELAEADFALFFPIKVISQGRHGGAFTSFGF